MNLLLPSFNTGETSPHIDARSDVEKYGAGCRTLENMLPRVYGGAERRPGTEFIHEAKNSPQGCRLIPFIYSSEIAYMCEFGDLYIRFYYDGAILNDNAGNPVETVTPYLVADLPKLQYVQLADTMWLVHPEYAPYKLTRTTTTSFALTKIVFKNGPFLDRNDIANKDGVTLACDVTTVGSVGTLTASAATFVENHVGALFQLIHKRTDNSVKIEAAGSTTAIDVKGTATWTTKGTWGGTVRLQRKDSTTDWDDYRVYVAQKKAPGNIQLSWTEKADNVQYRITVDAGLTGDLTTDINVHSPTVNGVVRIDSYVSSTIVNITVMSELASTAATLRWAEGAWSPHRGYPSALAFFDGRCVYGGTINNRSTVWFSATDDYEDFEEGANDDDSFSKVIPTTNEIRWLGGLEALCIGTSGDEWRMQSNKMDTPITPTNCSTKQQSSYGSAPLQCIKVNDSLLFADFVRRKVREFTYSDQYGKYVAPDLTVLAEHITETGIVAMAHQKNPDSILWGVRADGTLISMTYERDQNVVGWARHLVSPNQLDESSHDWFIEYLKHYPILRPLTTAEIPVKPSSPSVTTGSSAVANATQLQAMNGANSYILTADIDLTGVTWTPIVNFSGILDGNGHTISNLMLNSPTSDDQGLFANLNTNAQIHDLTLNNFTVTGKEDVGALAGMIDAQSAITIYDVKITNSSIAGEDYIGSLLGWIWSNGNVKLFDCQMDSVNVTGTGTYGYVGGMVGAWNMKSTRTANDDCVDCSVTGASTITGTVAQIGGMFGELAGYSTGGYFIYVHSCFVENTVSITPSSADIQLVGGFVGQDTKTKLTSCYSKAGITLPIAESTDTTSFIGGFVGCTPGKSEHINCYSTGNVYLVPREANSVESIGGYVGKVDTQDVIYLRCYSTGNITIDNEATQSAIIKNIGGFAGFLRGNSSGTGFSGEIKRCFSWGDIDINYVYTYLADGQAMGGFTGGWAYVPPLVENCYCWGSIIADGVVAGTTAVIGGFIGSSDSAAQANITVKNCYDAQTNSKYGSKLTKQIYDDDGGAIGGFLGAIETGGTYTVVATKCYWDTSTSGIIADASTGAEGHDTNWMMTKQNFLDAGWDLTTIWEMADGGYTMTDGAIGTVSTVAVMPATNEDEIWTAVLLNINGSPRRYILRFKPRKFDKIEDAFFVDAGLTIENNPVSATISGLGHLIGEEVIVLGDGTIYTPTAAVDPNGEITISTAISKAQVGTRFRYKLKPMRLDVGTREGTTQGSIMQCAEMAVSFLNAMNAKYGVDYTNLYDFDWTNVQWINNSTITGLFTGEVVAHVDGGFTIETPLIITGDDPLPCCVRAMIPRLQKTGR